MARPLPSDSSRVTAGALLVSLLLAGAGCARPPVAAAPRSPEVPLERQLPFYRFCMAHAVTTRLSDPPERDAPAAELARSAAATCVTRLVEAPDSPGRASPSTDSPMHARFEDARATALRELESRIAAWRAGPTPLFPVSGQAAASAPKLRILVPTAAVTVLPGASAAESGLAPCLRPEYPAAALRAGATGTTQVVIGADAAGRLVEAVVLHSAGPTREHRLLDWALVQSLAGCRFEPAPGILVRRTRIDYVWKLV